MKKFMILLVLPIMLMCSCVSANTNNASTITCPNVNSKNAKIAWDAIKKCDNKKILEKIFYYHKNFGSRFFAAKKISDKKILAKGRILAKETSANGTYQKKIKERLFELIDNRLQKTKKSHGETVEKPKIRKFTPEMIWKMDNIYELATIFHKHPDLKTRYHALKRVYSIFSFMPDLEDIYTDDVDKKVNNIGKIKNIIFKSIPMIKTIITKAKSQKAWKDKLLAELQRMYELTNPKEGEEAYIDREEFLREINAFRKENNLESISGYDERLNSAALKWAKYHFKNNLPNLTHEHNGSDFGIRIRAEGYNFGYGAENIDRPAMPNARTAFADWLSSAKHRKNMLGEHYREMGLACIFSPLPNRVKMDYICVQLLTDADYE